MSAKPKTPKKLDDSHSSITLSVPVVYADRIVNVGLGVAVSRLTLGVEAGENNIVPTTQIVLPTPAFFDAIEFMAKHLMTDESRLPIIEAMDQFKAKLTSST